VQARAGLGLCVLERLLRVLERLVQSASDFRRIGEDKQTHRGSFAMHRRSGGHCLARGSLGAVEIACQPQRVRRLRLELRTGVGCQLDFAGGAADFLDHVLKTALGGQRVDEAEPQRVFELRRWTVGETFPGARLGTLRLSRPKQGRHEISEDARSKVVRVAHELECAQQQVDRDRRSPACRFACRGVQPRDGVGVAGLSAERELLRDVKGRCPGGGEAPPRFEVESGADILGKIFVDRFTDQVVAEAQASLPLL
jgi:hypothetical protein